MGRQGGIARFTGSVGNINCYFDTGIEVVRRKPEVSKKRLKKSPRYQKSRESAVVFGASSVIAAALWKGVPKPMKRLADGAAYGRLVGAVRELTERDGQLWDAGFLQGMDLSLDAVGPHFVSPSAPQNGVGAGKGLDGADCERAYRLVGIDELMADLDAALGDSAGKMPLKCLLAHPFWTDGLVHTEAKGEEESVEFFQNIRRWGLLKKWKACFGEAPSTFQSPLRRVRVWVHATEVVETMYLPWQRRYTRADGQRMFSNGFVTEWVAGQSPEDWESEYLIAGRDWRTEWMGDGIYVVYTAIEVQEKRGRHWVRLPWCCKFGIQDVVVVAGGVEVKGQGAEREFEKVLTANRSLSQRLSPVCEGCARVRIGKVGYLDENGEIVIVEGGPKIGREIKVWKFEDLLPPGKLVVSVKADDGGSDVKEQGARLLDTVEDEKVAFAIEDDILRVDLVRINGVLLESKGPWMPDFYRAMGRLLEFSSWQEFVMVGDYLDFGIRAGP